jgi:hypothetical protein
MSMVRHQIAEHDVVAFRDAIGRWPLGTVGAVVSDYGDVKLVEIANPKGVALDFVQVPASQLDLVAPAT